MRRTLYLISIALLAGLVATAAFAQATTATIRGKVTNDHGSVLANAEINAVSTSSGFVHTVNGSFNLAGLTPGEYNIVVAAPAYEAKSETVTVLVGQNLEMTFVLSPTAVVNESITVVGNQFVDTKTPEIATNVTPQQMESLPQDDRNFLNFAGMAPGIRLSADPLSKTFAGDAQDPEETNIFIDGVSTKNDVLLGGTSGQDSSRGNPFPQSAVQEFRVITQNYSAQYDHASSAIITAVTKSGGNELSGSAFGFWQPKQWVRPSPVVNLNYGYGTLANNAAYHRIQPGIDVGGPIIKDKLNYFLDYEGDDEHAVTQVGVPAQYLSQFGSNNGTFASPFKQTLLFGKVSWQATPNQLLDTSINYRREHETRDFGGTTTFESATDLRNWVYGGTVRHQWNNSSALNEASLSFQKYGWNPTPLNPTEIGLNYEGCCRLGGNSTTQEFDQRRIELRDNYNFAPWNMKGTHNFQVGGDIDWMHYLVNKSLYGNPEFDFRSDATNGFDYSQPYQAQFGFGNPILSTGNNEYGIYGQDNWAVNQHLQLNLGLRWDYETHMLDENFVTPANIVAALKGQSFQANGETITIPDEYFSNVSQRKPYKDMFQPRLGFSYDLAGNSKQVIFGGWGRYYDRLYLNSTLDERFRLQYPVYNIQFCPTTAKAGACPAGAIPWNPSYESVAGLNALIASGKASPEIHLLSNNTKPPYSNQWNIGYRQAFGSWLASASYNNVRGYRGITWVSATGTCCSALAPGYGAVILSDPVGKSYWYSAESFTLDRPYTSQSRWGARFVYTHSTAEQNGNDLFSLDLPSAADYARHPINGSEPNHINATGIVGLPWDVRFSTNITLGTGPAVDVFDLSQGFDLAGHLKTGVINSAVYPRGKNSWGYQDVDFRLEKDFPLAGKTSVGLIGEVFNAFNYAVYGCLSNFLGPGGDPSTLGQPGCVVSLGRREQVGFKVNF